MEWLAGASGTVPGGNQGRRLMFFGDRAAAGPAAWRFCGQVFLFCVAAGILPAVEGGVMPLRAEREWRAAGQNARLYGRQDVRRHGAVRWQY
jgi:hypothetical protein